MPDVVDPEDDAVVELDEDAAEVDASYDPTPMTPARTIPTPDTAAVTDLTSRLPCTRSFIRSTSSDESEADHLGRPMGRLDTGYAFPG